MRVAVFGGSFDPPTKSHIAVAAGVASHRELQLDEVWLMPAFTHAFGKGMTFYETRMEMCTIAAKWDARIKVAAFESMAARSESGLQDSTFKTAMFLARTFSDIEFKFIIGMDNAVDFDRWLYHDQLRDQFSFIVVPRKGYEHRPDAWYMQDGRHTYLADVDSVGMSSTQMREALYGWVDRSGEIPQVLQDGLDQNVLKYIVDRGLYLSHMKFRFLKNVLVYGVNHWAGEVHEFDPVTDRLTENVLEMCIGHGARFPLKIGDEVELLPASDAKKKCPRCGFELP
jgi:nicotinate-nucleotide adenylyltransferase